MKKIFLCSICNINSGTCNEDCKFCSQSVRYKANIQRYKRKDIDTIKQEAIEAQQNGALGFCLVSSNRSLDDAMVEFVSNIAKEVKKVAPKLRLIGCNGTASTQHLQLLKEAGISAYNHNLETSKEFYPNICTTHSWDERFQTCVNVNKVGLSLLCGGIFGLGETLQDRVSMLNSIAELNPISVPINFYHHNEALSLKENPLSIDESLELIKLTKKMVPTAQRIMVAGGREMMFGSRQQEIFEAGANSIVIGNYLTTKGIQANKDLLLLKELGLEVAKSVE